MSGREETRVGFESNRLRDNPAEHSASGSSQNAQKPTASSFSLAYRSPSVTEIAGSPISFAEGLHRETTILKSASLDWAADQGTHRRNPPTVPFKVSFQNTDPQKLRSGVLSLEMAYLNSTHKARHGANTLNIKVADLDQTRDGLSVLL
jgi:hypothetical protein